MRIVLKDATGCVSVNYIQSLVLLYLPCETFSETAENGDGWSLSVSAETDGQYGYTVSVGLVLDGRRTEKTETCLMREHERLSVKNFIGRVCLSALKEAFGYMSPWGILTGIRPAKLAAAYLKSRTAEETERILAETYAVSPQKAHLCVQTAQKEREMTENLPDGTCSLYISVPFCPTKCRYCSFVSCTTSRLLALIPDYVERLKREISDIADTVNALGLTLKTVYVGGGTPAVLDEKTLSGLLAHISGTFDIASLEEYTFEAGRPDCITEEKLRLLHENGVGRVSINTQTANDEILKAVGRTHTFADYERCMDLAKRVGISCLNTDLIAGLPGETTESFYDSVRRVLTNEPQNVTVHAFTLKRSSEYKTAHSAVVDTASFDAGEMVSYAARVLTEADYAPYYLYRQKNTVGNLENVGYARDGFESRYNIYMMGEYHTVFGAGAGAVTKLVPPDGKKIRRLFAPKYPYEYLDESKYGGFDRASVEAFYAAFTK